MKAVEFGRVTRPKTMKSYVHETLQAAIVQGLIAQTDVLSEASLAEKFGVSRTPVREVLQELEREGLLENAGSRGGKRVRRLRPDEVRELFWLRSVIEGGTVEHLAKSGMSERDLSEVTTLLDAQEKALEANDRVAFLKADSDFHVALARATGFPKVTQIIMNLRRLFQLVGAQAVSYPHRTEEVMCEHRAIVAAIQSRDASAARTAIETHLAHTEKLVTEQLAAGVHR